MRSVIREPPGTEKTSPRRVLGLAVPALGVLAAEPLYVLVDTAVVGRLGAVPLGGLAVGGVLLSQLATNLTFLSYGTTSRAARLYGAARRPAAVAEGMQATWLAAAVGTAVVLLVEFFAAPMARLLAGDPATAEAAAGWLRIAVLGAPFILIAMAGNGWLRGVQDSRRPLRYVLAGNGISAVLCPVLVWTAGWGLTGSAVANVVAQAVSGGLFLRALAKENAFARPHLPTVRGQLVLGRDLIVRTLAFQVCLLSATAVAARTSTAAVGAHQIVWQLWNFLTLVQDSLAIAAQSLVGAALGAGNRREATALAGQITRYGLVLGCVLCAVFLAAEPVLPPVFTGDPGVLAEVPQAWWFFAAVQPLAGIVFALDGVLLGAGDARFMRTAALCSAALGYLPMIWLSLAFGWGLAGIWAGLVLFILLRLVAMVSRWRSGRWAVTGAAVPRAGS